MPKGLGKDFLCCSKDTVLRAVDFVILQFVFPLMLLLLSILNCFICYYHYFYHISSYIIIIIIIIIIIKQVVRIVLLLTDNILGDNIHTCFPTVES